MTSSSSPTLTEQDEWSKKVADLLRSMPAELREPANLRAVLLGAVRDLSVNPHAAPPVSEVPTVSTMKPAAPVMGIAVETTSTLIAVGPTTPTVVASSSVREDAPLSLNVPSLKSVASTLSLPLRLAHDLINDGHFDTQAFRQSYGNGWNPVNREFGRQFADELARCAERKIARGASWASVTHNALVGLTALTSTVMNTGINTLMDRLAHHAPESLVLSQSMAKALQEVFTNLPAGHPASHPDMGMDVRAQCLEVLANRQSLEVSLDLKRQHEVRPRRLSMA